MHVVSFAATTANTYIILAGSAYVPKNVVPSEKAITCLLGTQVCNHV